MQGEHKAAEGFDAGEVARFDRLARDWWDPKGPMKPLHKINPVRLAFLKREICAHFGRDERALDALSGLTILDIGCGGGLLCEPLARMGASVTGVDPAGQNIGVARLHAEDAGLDITYRETLAEALAGEGKTFDIVLAMEVVEHVPDLGSFVKTAASLVRPGGFFGGSTLNRTMRAFALAIVGAEYVLRWLPRGTHSWNKFVTPDEFETALERCAMGPGVIEGMVFDPLRDQWRLSRDTAVNYFITAIKPD